MMYHLQRKIDSSVKSGSRSCCRVTVSVAVLLGVIVGFAELNYKDESQLNFPNIETTRTTKHSLRADHFGQQLFGRNTIRNNLAKQRLPNCIIIGIRKAGTRALIESLRLHPQIRPAGKEVHFFDRNPNFSKGYDWYRRHMPLSYTGQITVEKTPAYFPTLEVPQRVHKFNDSIKLLLIVRDPVSRLVSDYLQLNEKRIASDKTTQTFENLAFDYETGRVRTSYKPITRSLYSVHMRNWLRFFALNQFLIIDGDEFTKDPLPQLKLVEDFLGIEHKLNHDMFYFNKTRGFYCLHKETDEKCLAKSKGRVHPDVDPKVISALRQYFAPYNQEFYKMVERDFGWLSWKGGNDTKVV